MKPEDDEMFVKANRFIKCKYCGCSISYLAYEEHVRACARAHILRVSSKFLKSTFTESELQGILKLAKEATYFRGGQKPRIAP